MSEVKKKEKNSFYGKEHSDKTKDIISKKNSKIVFEYDVNHLVVKRWDSLTMCSIDVGISISYLSACIKNNKVYKGSIYSYEKASTNK